MKKIQIFVLAYFITTVTIVALLSSLLSTSRVEASFPGLNGRIVLSSNRDGENEIFTMKADGSDVKQLTVNSLDDTAARWSSDGTKIIFQSNRDGNNEIYTMNADGTNQTRITNNAANDQSPNFSPDGSKIVFQTDRTGNNEIYIMNSDGSNPTNVSNDSLSQQGPNWSPDGSRVTFVSQKTGPAGPRRVDTIKTDGTDRINLTDPAGTNNEIAIGPDWSPDGQWIIFHSNAGVAACPCIYKIKPDGTSRTGVPADTNGFQPSYSPDGTKIVFRSNRDGNNEIYTMNADGTNQTRITNNTASDALTGWQPLTIPPSSVPSAPNPIAVQPGQPVLTNILERHSDTYGSLDPSTLTITSPPKYGTASVNNIDGTISYAFNADLLSIQFFWQQFATTISSLFFPKVHAQSTSTDTLGYQVCSTENSALCTTGTLSFTLPDNGELAGTGQDRQLLLQIAGFSIFITSVGLVLQRKRFTR